MTKKKPKSLNLKEAGYLHRASEAVRQNPANRKLMDTIHAFRYGEISKEKLQGAFASEGILL